MSISPWLKDSTFKSRNSFREYIHGLIRYEIHEGQDNDKRLEVLSKIYYDLLYMEDLRDSRGYKKKVSDKDDLTKAYEKIRQLEEKLQESDADLNELLEFINNSKTKKDIIDFVEKVKKSRNKK